MSQSAAATGGSSSDALCCCEYVNTDGNRSHILATCCDCEALDETVDTLVTCGRIPHPLRRKLFRTIEDRCRIPWIYGGAMKIRMDTIFPIIFIPFCMVLATVHFYVTVPVLLLLMPLTMLLYYRRWRKAYNKTRTKMFLSWALTSIIGMLVIFEVFILPFRKVLLWEHVLLLSSSFILFYLMNYVARNTSLIESKTHVDSVEMKPINGRNGPVTSGQKSMFALEKDKSKDGYFTESISSRALLKNSENEQNMCTVDIEGEPKQEIKEADVTWIDSRPIIGGKLVTMCEQCHSPRPPRSGHCKLCDACIDVRDHHCVWLDVCIGARNHRAFLLTVLVFIFCGFYGSHLTLTTICIPEMYWDWFLLPSHCEMVYSDFPNAICFVSVCYTLIVTLLVCGLLGQQLILISQNLTSQELHRARSRDLVSYSMYARQNVHNSGVLRNWWSFLTLPRRPSSAIIADSTIDS